MNPLKSYICGCARNCKEFLPKVFINIEKIIELLDDFHIVIAFDMSNDATLHELYEWRTKFRNKMTIVHNNEDLSYLRVKNISNARNRILRYMEEDNEHTDFHYFINMDMDDVCASPININVLEDVLNKERNGESKWDVLSFYRNPYYDVWAFSGKPYYFSCWNFPRGFEAVAQIRDYLESELDNRDAEDLMEVLSAFNGFAIYRKSAMKDCYYDWNIRSSANLLGKERIEETAEALRQYVIRAKMDQDCEHRFFHLSAIEKNGAKIYISSAILFS